MTIASTSEGGKTASPNTSETNENVISPFFNADGSYATKILKLSYAKAPSAQWKPDAADLVVLDAACALLMAGHPVAIPTETVYGLAAPLQRDAVAAVFTAKRRPADNPLIVHVSSLDMVEPLLPEGTELPSVYAPLAARFWPGPLTMVLPGRSTIPSNVTAGLSTVAVRFPSHPVCKALISRLGEPLAAPSANSSGRPSPTLASHVFDDLNGRIALILDGGPCDGGIESTVVDGTDPARPVILRNGGVTAEMLKHVEGWENVVYYKDLDKDKEGNDSASSKDAKGQHESLDPELYLDVNSSNGQQNGNGIGKDPTEIANGDGSGAEYRPKAPGMKYRHYAPRGLCIVARLDPLPANDGEKLERLRQAASKEAKARGKQGKLGVLACLDRPAGSISFADNSETTGYNLGPVSDRASHAAHLFAALRHVDADGAVVVAIEKMDGLEEGRGVMERVEKAAEGGEIVA